MSVALRVADLESADLTSDGAAIDIYVRAHAQATPFHLSGWSRAVARGCGQTNHYLLAEIDGAIVGILPLTVVHSPLFGRVMASSGERLATSNWARVASTALPASRNVSWISAADDGVREPLSRLGPSRPSFSARQC